MATIRNKQANTAAAAATTGEKKVTINFPRKVNFDNRPALVGFFSVVTEGYPVFGRVSLTENKNDKLNILFPHRSYEKDGKKNYRDYIHPVDADTRKALLDAAGHLFEKVYEADDFDNNQDHPLRVEPYEENGVTLRYPNKRENANFPELLGDVSFQTEKQMCMEEVELLKNKDGNYFLVFPANHRKQADGSYKDYPHCGPASSETREAILAAAVEAFEKL